MHDRPVASDSRDKLGTDGDDSGAAVPLDLPSFSNRQNLREGVQDALRSAIITGAMRPGAVYSAVALAEKLGVSPTPVREAMLDLVKQNLVEVIRNKGFRVVQLFPQDLDDLVQLRVLIEVPTIGVLARAPDASALAALRPVARAIERAADRGDPIALMNADTSFHLQLLSLAGNRHLVEVVKELRARSRLYRLPEVAHDGSLRRSIAEHTELLDLIADGRPQQAEGLMLKHIGHVRGIWTTHLAEPDSGHDEHAPGERD